MRFNAAFVCVFAWASSLVLLQSASAERLKRQARVGVKRNGEPSTPVKRHLGGSSGKGSSSSDSADKWPGKFPCEFCGEGNDSALGLSPINGTCFSKDSTVQVQGVDEPVTMKDLRVGDMILTQEGVYERVYAFGHHAPSKKATFLQLFTGNAAPLEMTGEHLVYLANKANPVKAASVRPGDVLRGAGSGKDTIIQDIRTVEKEGIYAPLTIGGRLLVDGIQVSSYVSIQDTTSSDRATQQSAVSSEYLVIQASKVQIPIMSHHEYVHMALAPYRMMCRVAGNALCNTTQSSTFSGKEGMPSYIAFGIWFNLFSSRYWAVHPWAVIATILVTSPFWFLEKLIFSDSFGLALYVFAALWAVWAAQRKCRRF